MWSDTELKETVRERESWSKQLISTGERNPVKTEESSANIQKSLFWLLLVLRISDLHLFYAGVTPFTSMEITPIHTGASEKRIKSLLYSG